MANAKTTNVSFDIPTVAKSIGQNIYDLQVAVVKTVDLTATLQETADKLRAAGIVFGKSVKTCTWRKTIADTITHLAKEKAAQKTCMNYVTSFVSAVNNGTKFSLSDSKGKAKGKGKGTAEVELATLLAKVYNHKDFGEVFGEIQHEFETKFENDEQPALILLIEDYLKKNGMELKEVDA